jgi:hypothetical protein
MCFVFTKVALQGKVSYWFMPANVLEGSKNLKSKIVTCTYNWDFLKVMSLFSYINPYFPSSILRKSKQLSPTLFNKLTV